jgi:UDP-glucose 4-epimerase
LTRPGHVLITGGAGFIGSHLADRLVTAGVRVSVLDDLSRGSRDWVPAGASVYEVDIRDAAGVRAAFENARPDAVAHLAALHFIPQVDDAPELAWSINVEGTEAVFEAAARSRLTRVLFASTAAVYPNVPTPLSELVEPAPIDLYGRTKLEGEQLARRYVDGTGRSCVVARLFNVIGPRETNPHVLPEIVDQLRNGAAELELGNLEPRRDYIDVRDAAEALYRLLISTDDGELSVYNVGTGRAVSVLDLVRECERILGREIAIRQAADRMRSVERMLLLADRSAIAAAVGWEPERSLADTLAELLNGAP